MAFTSEEIAELHAEVTRTIDYSEFATVHLYGRLRVAEWRASKTSLELRTRRRAEYLRNIDTYIAYNQSEKRKQSSKKYKAARRARDAAMKVTRQ